MVSLVLAAISFSRVTLLMLTRIDAGVLFCITSPLSGDRASLFSFAGSTPFKSLFFLQETNSMQHIKKIATHLCIFGITIELDCNKSGLLPFATNDSNLNNRILKAVLFSMRMPV
jgi:hypothetical protein